MLLLLILCIYTTSGAPVCGIGHVIHRGVFIHGYSQKQLRLHVTSIIHVHSWKINRETLIRCMNNWLITKFTH